MNPVAVRKGDRYRSKYLSVKTIAVCRLPVRIRMTRILCALVAMLTTTLAGSAQLSTVAFKLVAQVPMEMARDVAFDGDIAWVSQNLLGMTAVNISDPEKPRIAREFAPSEIQPLHFKLLDPHLLVIADRFRGLVLWDVQNADRPTSLSCLALPGVATHVDVSLIKNRLIAAVACGGEGLCLVEITDSRAPALLSRFDVQTDFTRGIALRGSTAFVADNHDGGIKVLDISDPARPRPYYKVSLRGSCDSVMVRDDLLVVNYRNQGGRTFRINQAAPDSTPTLTLLSNFSRGRSAIRDLLALGNKMIVANDLFGLEMYDFSNPQLPYLMDEYPYKNAQELAYACAFYRAEIYVPSWDGGLKIFRVENRDH